MDLSSRPRQPFNNGFADTFGSAGNHGRFTAEVITNRHFPSSYGRNIKIVRGANSPRPCTPPQAGHVPFGSSAILRCDSDVRFTPKRTPKSRH